MRRGTLNICAVAASIALAAPVWASGPQQQPPSHEAQQDQKSQAATFAPAPTVQMKDLEENPSKYLNQRVTVQAEVEDVLGPRVFKVDEANWADLDPELLVVMEAPLAALVKEDDRVTITGTLRPFVDVDVEREWGWLDVEPGIEARIKTRPVLVASSIVGGDPSADLFFTVTSTAPAGTAKATGTSGTTTPKRTGAPVSDVAQLAKATDNSLVGRHVNLSSVRVERTAKEGGFWVSAGGDELFVLPADSKANRQPGQTVSIEGHVLRLPEQMEARIEKSKRVGNEEIYVFATTVR